MEFVLHIREPFCGPQTLHSQVEDSDEVAPPEVTEAFQQVQQHADL